MRGKAGSVDALCIPCGITPAYAGKSHRFAITRIDVEDHPRLCGEKLPGGRTTSKNMGSPPPMRGKGKLIVDRVLRVRITPAYAGKSQPRQAVPH